MSQASAEVSKAWSRFYFLHRWKKIHRCSPWTRKWSSVRFRHGPKAWHQYVVIMDVEFNFEKLQGFWCHRGSKFALPH